MYLPQGVFVVPAFICLPIKYLVNLLSEKMLLFADDAKFIYLRWSAKNKLTLNASKRNLIGNGCHILPPKLKVNTNFVSSALATVHASENLGMCVDET